MSMEEEFTRAYKDGRWHHGSGSGSSAANTVAYRRFVEEYVRRHAVRQVVDVGCGDWQFSRLIDWGTASYLGVDVVAGLVAVNQVRYGSARVRFAWADILSHEWTVPDGTGLVLVKDLLQHWPDAAVAMLRGKLAGHRALLTYDLGDGPDIEAGCYRPLDLAARGWPVREVLRYTSFSHDGHVRRVKVTAELAP